MNMVTLRNFMEKINSAYLRRPLSDRGAEGTRPPTGKKIPVSIMYNEPMYRHTTFKIGGKADVLVRPHKEIFPAYASELLMTAREEGIPVFILGAGANIVVSDKGIRGIVLDTSAFRGVERREARKAGDRKIEAEKAVHAKLPTEKEISARADAEFEAVKARRAKAYFSISVLSGTSVDGLAARLAERGLSGMEFLAGMPGSVGGALWMNARCYEKSISDLLIETEVLNENFELEKIPFNAEDFSYKKSPFQARDALILSARFTVSFWDSREIRREIAAYRRDRMEKGHYRYPSAGSAFKNNRDFGDPTGRIIDKLGLRGLSIGGAQIAPWHGNLVVNTGNATASDIKVLMDEVGRRVKEERGFDLESEILFVGDWG